MKQLTLLVLIIFFWSCNKNNNSNSVPSKAYTFENHTGRKVFLDFYKTKTDMNGNKNLLQHFSANNGESIIVNLEPKKTFYLDWYSEDYVLSNWLNNKTNGEVFPSQTFYADTINTNFSISIPDTIYPKVFSRKILLNKSLTNTNWTAISFYPDFGFVNTWNQIPAYMKSISFTFQKDYFMYFHYLDSTGNNYDIKNTMKIYFDKFSLVFNNANNIKGEVMPTPSLSYDTLEFHVTDFSAGARRGMYQLVRMPIAIP